MSALLFLMVILIVVLLQIAAKLGAITRGDANLMQAAVHIVHLVHCLWGTH